MRNDWRLSVFRRDQVQPCIKSNFRALPTEVDKLPFVRDPTTSDYLPGWLSCTYCSDLHSKGVEQS